MYLKHAESLFFKLLLLQLGSKFWDFFLIPKSTVDSFYEATHLAIYTHTIYNVVQVYIMGILRNENVSCSILEIS